MHSMDPRLMRAVNEHRFANRRMNKRWEPSRPVPGPSWIVTVGQWLAGMRPDRRLPGAEPATQPVGPPPASETSETIEIVLPDLEGRMHPRLP
jgi:hypothetical protein